MGILRSLGEERINRRFEKDLQKYFGSGASNAFRAFDAFVQHPVGDALPPLDATHRVEFFKYVCRVVRISGREHLVPARTLAAIAKMRPADAAGLGRPTYSDAAHFVERYRDFTDNILFSRLSNLEDETMPDAPISPASPVEDTKRLRSLIDIITEEISASRLTGITVDEAARRHRSLSQVGEKLAKDELSAADSVREYADASAMWSWLLFLAVPCADMTDVGKKAVRLLEITSGRGAEGMTAEELNLFARSLLGMGVSSDAGRDGEGAQMNRSAAESKK